MINRKFISVALAATIFMGGLGLTVYAMDAPQGVATTSGSNEGLDTTLSDKVETLLRTDIGLAGSQFRVQGHSGIITLGGTVPDEHALRRALDLVSGVRGVREIRNNMEIASPK